MQENASLTGSTVGPCWPGCWPVVDGTVAAPRVFFLVGAWIDTHTYNRRLEVRELGDVEELEDVEELGDVEGSGWFPAGFLGACQIWMGGANLALDVHP